MKSAYRLHTDKRPSGVFSSIGAVDYLVAATFARLLLGLTSMRSQSLRHFTQNSNQVPRVERGRKVSVAKSVLSGMHGQ